MKQLNQREIACIHGAYSVHVTAEWKHQEAHIDGCVYGGVFGSLLTLAGYVSGGAIGAVIGCGAGATAGYIFGYSFSRLENCFLENDTTYNFIDHYY